MKKYLILLLFVSILGTTWAQETNETEVKRSTPSPDFPGSLVLEYGLNYLTNPTPSMRTNPYTSITLNVYYMYPLKIKDSRFSVNPGIGVGSEKFGFEDPVTFFDSLGFTLLTNIRDHPRYNNIGEVKKTQFIANYIDFPLEFRVHLFKDDHDRSLFFAVGGKIGVNFYAKTKIKYSELGSNKIEKDKFHFNVNSFRYGLTARFGYGPINAWYYYSGSQLFRGNKTPNMNNPGMWSFGLSMSTF